MYVAWALTDVLAANKVSEVGEMMMGVAASEVSRAMMNRGGCSPHTWHGHCARSLCCYTTWLQRWSARWGDDDGVLTVPHCPAMSVVWVPHVSSLINHLYFVS